MSKFNSLFGSDINSPFGISGAGKLSDNVTDFINLHPNWLLYVRRDTRFPCLGCWDPEARSAKQRCSDCLGTGYIITFERHPVRLVTVLSPGPFATQPGYFNNFLVTIYSDVHHIPASRDLFFEVEWDIENNLIGTQGKPVRIIHGYEIRMIANMREDSVSFFSSGCQAYDFDNEFLEKSILTHPALLTL
jgi:hypothetical protein